ncbi:MAG: M28 family peptidase, partial [Candidatus Thorarchaeota archaeon]|nr:M28 family peptidase [Candidatus Thorarchaeota archaeon]
MSKVRTVILILSLMLIAPITLVPFQVTYSPLFDGDNAFSYLTDQCDFGPRPPGSENLSECREYIFNTLVQEGWTVSFQNFTYRSVDCVNIIATWPVQNSTITVLGAHYDTRPHADQESDPEDRTRPVLGANDGASGVAALLELARVLPEAIRSSIEMVFFDAEDSGYIDDWDWIVGSTHYVDQLTSSKRESITAMILLDMIGDVNLRIPREASSTDSLQDRLWSIAADLGHDDVFLDTPGSSILDDHRPFLAAGIPAVDLIHTPFPWTWHTLQDTPDNCSPESLEAVGRVVEYFLVELTASTVSTTPFPTDPP